MTAANVVCSRCEQAAPEGYSLGDPCPRCRRGRGVLVARTELNEKKKPGDIPSRHGRRGRSRFVG